MAENNSVHVDDAEVTLDTGDVSLIARNARRRRAVQMRLDGMNVQQTCLQCGLSRTTVGLLWKAFLSGGWDAVDVRRPGRPIGAGRVLSPDHESQVMQWMLSDYPSNLGLAAPLWSRVAVCKLIRQRLGIVMEDRTLNMYLKRWRLCAAPAVQFPEDVATQARLSDARMFCIQETASRVSRADSDHRRILTAVSPKGVCLWAAYPFERDSIGREFIARLAAAIKMRLVLVVSTDLLVMRDVEPWLSQSTLRVTLKWRD